MSWFSRKQYRAAFTGVTSGLLYEEYGKRMIIDCERLAEPLGVLVYTQTMKWQSPHDAEILEKADIERIQKNITDSLGSFNLKWV